MGLLGRQREREALERLLEVARGGRGGVLVVHGEPGVGKTALLEYAVEAGPDFRVVRAGGVEGRWSLRSRALQQLCAPILELSERLPDPQRDALARRVRAERRPTPRIRSWSGWRSSACCRRRPRSGRCSAWSTTRSGSIGASARALAFVARRLLAERIAIVFAAREPGERAGGLPGAARRAAWATVMRGRCLESVLPGRLDERVLERIVVETRGNPLALLELPRGLSPAQLAGGFGLPASLPCPRGSRRASRGGWRSCPADARRLLLARGGRPARRSCASSGARLERLGIPESAARTVESEGLLALGAGVAFRHPLVRSAVYRAAAPNERQRGPPRAGGGDRSADRPGSPRVAPCAGGVRARRRGGRELERSAARAQARGGFAAAAAFLERAAELTPDPLAARSARWSRLRRSSAQARSTTRSVCCSSTEAGSLDELERARVDLLRAQIAFVSTHGSDAPRAAARAARRLEPLDPDARPRDLPRGARRRRCSRDGWRRRAQLARCGSGRAGRATRPPRPRRPSTLLARRTRDAVHRGLRGGACRSCAGRTARSTPARCPRGAAALAVARDRLVRPTSGTTIAGTRSPTRHVRVAREAGALGELPLALEPARRRASLRGRAGRGGVARRRSRTRSTRGDRQQPARRTARWDSPRLRGREAEAI